jgi:hypothetical protein
MYGYVYGCVSLVVFACLGFLSPANRGALMTCTLVLYVCLGTPAGYVSARIYKSKAAVDRQFYSDVHSIMLQIPHIVQSFARLYLKHEFGKNLLNGRIQSCGKVLVMPAKPAKFGHDRHKWLHSRIA